MTTNSGPEARVCCQCGQPDCRPDCPLRAPYDTVMAGIHEGTVSPDDFNALLEVLDKSAKERVLRRTREPKITPQGRENFGRVVPKLAGHDDPPHQGRGRRFASGRVPKERQNRDQARAKAPAVVAPRQPLDPQVLDKATATEGRNYELFFDKAGYANSLREELQRRGLQEDRDWRYHHSVLWLRRGVQLDEGLMDWLLQVGRARPQGYDPRSIFR